MKIYCSCCDKVQPVRIDNCRDAKTHESFQDIVCATCDLVIASGTDIAQPEQDYLAGVPPMLPQMRDGETIVVTEYAQPEQEPVALLNAIRAEPTEMIHKWRVIDIIQSSPPQGIYYTQPHRKPLIHEEAPAFRKWFDAWWVGDGEQGETVPPQGDAFDEYLANYTLAFGAWMAAKEAAHGIKE